MKKVIGGLMPALGLITLVFTITPSALAACGSGKPIAKKSSWLLQSGQPRLLRTAFGDDEGPAAIVGFWHFKFISDGNNWGLPPGVSFPKGSEFDAGYSQWHSDGTEITNSGSRAPITGDFCLGVWARVGPRQFKLNHFAASWDPTPTADSPMGTLIGPGNILELVTVSKDGQSFSGPFSVDQYDESMNHIAHIEGMVYGTRITVDTSPSSIF